MLTVTQVDRRRPRPWCGSRTAAGSWRRTACAGRPRPRSARSRPRGTAGAAVTDAGQARPPGRAAPRRGGPRAAAAPRCRRPRPASSGLPNVSSPVHHGGHGSGRARRPRPASPTRSTPCSIAPVTTVPRPVMVSTFSIGIRNGRSRTRVGHRHVAVDRVEQVDHATAPSRVALQRPQRGHPYDRDLVAGEPVLGQQLPESPARPGRAAPGRRPRRPCSSRPRGAAPRPAARAARARASAASCRRARRRPGSRRPPGPRR